MSTFDLSALPGGAIGPIALLITAWMLWRRSPLQRLADATVLFYRRRAETATPAQHIARHGDSKLALQASTELLGLREMLGAAGDYLPMSMIRWRTGCQSLPYLFGKGPEVVKDVKIPGIPAWWVSTPGLPESENVILFIHGGGYLAGSGRTYTAMLGRFNRATNVPSLAIDYRLLLGDVTIQDAISDCVAGYDHLIGKMGYRPDQIIVMGDSAGGALVISMLQNLKKRGATMPLCAISVSPMMDCTYSLGASHKTARDPMLCPGAAEFFMEQFRRKHSDLAHPELSPINGSFQGLPPLMITTTNSEALQSDAEMTYEKAKAAGVDATLYNAEHFGLHIDAIVSPMYPEAAIGQHKLYNFIKKHTAGKKGAKAE
eukprot:Rhum_TRINITY_DN20770_c0_g1::Rhum_TRINITY_DN20770_c0_g1_i1::g.172121::m.172121/K14731/mlhB, chnC; epsilon-lactone hydrolase